MGKLRTSVYRHTVSSSYGKLPSAWKAAVAAMTLLRKQGKKVWCRPPSPLPWQKKRQLLEWYALTTAARRPQGSP